MTKRVPNLDIAIEECKRLGLTYRYERNKRSHYKFYIEDVDRVLIFNSKRDNKDRVKNDIQRLVNGR